MKHIKVLLFCLLLMPAAWAWSTEIHDAAFKGDLAKVKEWLAKDPTLIPFFYETSCNRCLGWNV